MDKGKCKSCGMPILWARTDNGKVIPLDVEGERRFVINHTEHNRVTNAVTYVSHFATCPNASEHRKPRDAKRS